MPFWTFVDEHHGYLADTHRMAAFDRAIRAVVQSGAVVLDLGAGTGILGLLAAEAGASRVYSVEASSLIDLTRQIVAANDWRDRFVFLRQRSTALELPERVDVVVADQIGLFGFDAGVFEYFADARERFLKPDGHTIPAKLSLWIAPVERDDLWAKADFWSRPVHGFDMHPAQTMAMNTGYRVLLAATDLLGSAEKLLTVDPGERVQVPWRVLACAAVERPGTLHGLGGWFSAEMTPEVEMSNSPLDPTRIQRLNVFLPITRPIAVAIGDRIKMELEVNPNDMVLTWKVAVWKSGSAKPLAEFSHSTWLSMPLSAEDLRRSRPGFIPELTPLGRARLAVLELCDQNATVDAIHREVRRRYPNLFRASGMVEKFVADIVARDAS